MDVISILIATACSVELKSFSTLNGAFGYIKINGVEVRNTLIDIGFVLAHINPTDCSYEIHDFFMYLVPPAAMRDYLQGLSPGSVVAGVTAQTTLTWFPTVTDILDQYGVNTAGMGDFDKLMFVGVKGRGSVAQYTRVNFCSFCSALTDSWTIGKLLKMIKSYLYFLCIFILIFMVLQE